MAGLDNLAALVPVLKELGAKHAPKGVVPAHCEQPLPAAECPAPPLCVFLACGPSFDAPRLLL